MAKGANFFDLALELQRNILQHALVQEDVVTLTPTHKSAARHLSETSTEMNIIKVTECAPPVHMTAVKIFLRFNTFLAELVSTDDGIQEFTSTLHHIRRMLAPKTSHRVPRGAISSLQDMRRLDIVVFADHGPSLEGYTHWASLFVHEQAPTIHRTTQLRYIDASGVDSSLRGYRKRLAHLQHSIQHGHFMAGSTVGLRFKIQQSHKKRSEVVLRLLRDFDRQPTAMEDDDDEQEAARLAAALRPPAPEEGRRFWDRQLSRLDAACGVGIYRSEEEAWRMFASEWVEDDAVREGMVMEEQAATEIRW